MQTRTLQTVLIDVENLLPDILFINTQLKKQLKKIQNGNRELTVGNSNITHFADLIEELEKQFERTPLESLEKNISARTRTAIMLGNKYVYKNNNYKKSCLQAQNALLLNEIRSTAPTTDLTDVRPSIIQSSSSSSSSTKRKRSSHAQLFTDPGTTKIYKKQKVSVTIFQHPSTPNSGKAHSDNTPGRRTRGLAKGSATD